MYDPVSGAGDWILDAANRTLLHWENQPDAADSLTWSPNAADVVPFDCGFVPSERCPAGPPVDALMQEPIRLEVAAWDICGMAWESYIKLAHTKLDEASERIAVAWILFFGPARSQDAPGKSADYHFRWLLESRVRRWNHAEIVANQLSAHKTEVGTQAVSDAIRNTARLLFGERSEALSFDRDRLAARRRRRGSTRRRAVRRPNPKFGNRQELDITEDIAESILTRVVRGGSEGTRGVTCLE